MLVLLSCHLMQKPEALIYSACKSTEDQHILLGCSVVSCTYLLHCFAEVCTVLTAIARDFNAARLVVRAHIVAQGVQVTVNDTGKLIDVSRI